MAVAELGEGPGGAAPLIFFILRPNWGPKGRKKFFWRPPPPPLSEGLDDLPPPPYLKVWICHCMVQFLSKEVMSNDAPYSMWIWDRPLHSGLRPLLFTKIMWVFKRSTEFIICVRVVRQGLRFVGLIRGDKILTGFWSWLPIVPKNES